LVSPAAYFGVGSRGSGDVAIYTVRAVGAVVVGFDFVSVRPAITIRIPI
jgi:hypothetical protein